MLAINDFKLTSLSGMCHLAVVGSLEFRNFAMSLKSWFKHVFLGATVATGVLTSLGIMARPANAFSVAYCEGQRTAINIYQTIEMLGTDRLAMRLYVRSNNQTINIETKREYTPEGYNYTSDDGQTRAVLFMPKDDSTCTLSFSGLLPNGTTTNDLRIFDSGTVTSRQPHISQEPPREPYCYSTPLRDRLFCY